MKKEKILTIIGSSVAKIRKQRGISKYALAKKVGMPYQSILRTERGQTNISYYALLGISKGLDVDISQLVKGVK